MGGAITLQLIKNDQLLILQFLGIIILHNADIQNNAQEIDRVYINVHLIINNINCCVTNMLILSPV